MFQFDSLSAFVAMGGHGFYIWLSYLFTALVMVWLVATPLLRKNRLFHALKRQQFLQHRETRQHQDNTSPDACSEERTS